MWRFWYFIHKLRGKCGPEIMEISRDDSSLTLEVCKRCGTLFVLFRTQPLTRVKRGDYIEGLRGVAKTLRYDFPWEAQNLDRLIVGMQEELNGSRRQAQQS